MAISRCLRTRTAFLSPLDQLNSSFYIRWSLVLHAKDRDKAVYRLSKGLNAVTSTLPFLKGRINYHTDNANNKITSASRAVISMSDDSPNLSLRELRPSKDLPSLARIKQQGAPSHLFTDDLYSLPIFIDTTSKQSHPVLKTTYAPIEGGLILNICVHHGVMDGQGLATLTDLWASFTRQQDQNENEVQQPKNLPEPDEPLTRTARLAAALNATADPEITDIETSLQRYRNDRILEQNIAPSPGDSRKKTSRIFAFSSDKLKDAKEVLANNGCHVTTNSILNAAVWSNLTRVRLSRRTQLPPTPFARFTQMVDGRRQLLPKINKPGPYMGNVVLTSSADVSLDTLVTTGFFNYLSVSLMAPVAQAIYDASRKVTTEYIDGFLKTLQKVDDPARLGIGSMSQHGVDFISTSVANAPFYECDFGPSLSEDSASGNEGKPVFVRYPYIDWADGNMILLPRRVQPAGLDETIEAHIMLAEEDLVALAEDPGICSWLKE
uniref:Acyltransferase n=1 Tax=Fusarium armeniacum TaxID=679435 RepID=D2JM10_9HYPO|nr:acyltransferase [Fusarium armeniacum]